jgi:transposase
VRLRSRLGTTNHSRALLLPFGLGASASASAIRLNSTALGPGNWCRGQLPELRVCYEAGPTGDVVYGQLTALGVQCEVVAPTLVPVKPGDRVKTDRRDALKLARSYRAGDLTAVWVPDAAQEALRDLVRAREAAKQDQLRARHRLGKFLLRQGRRPAPPMHAWTQTHLAWVKTVHVAHAAQEATVLDDLHEVEHMADRLTRLERAINRRDNRFGHHRCCV